MKEKRKEKIDIYQVIYDRIVSGEYSSGYRLVEADLGKEFNVSRTPVRLAIERLVSEGFARHVPNKGATVRQLSIDDILGLYAIREVNEGLAARLACRYATEADAKELYHILDEMEKTDNIADYYPLCSQIHRYIFSMSKNEFLSDFINNIYSITSRFHIAVLSLPERSSGSKEEHRNLVDAILSKDEDRAETVMREHIRHNAFFYQDETVKSSLKALSKLNWQAF